VRRRILRIISSEIKIVRHGGNDGAHHDEFHTLVAVGVIGICAEIHTVWVFSGIGIIHPEHPFAAPFLGLFAFHGGAEIQAIIGRVSGIVAGSEGIVRNIKALHLI